MPKSATSPSGFIYQRATASPVALPMPDDPVMEPTGPSAPGIFRPREPLATNRAPWEAADQELPMHPQTNRRATLPTTLIPRVSPKRLQSGFPCEKHDPANCLNFACHCQTETLPAQAAGLPPVMVRRNSGWERTFLPSYISTTTANPRCINNTASYDSCQPRFPIPLLQNITSPCSPAAPSGTGSRTLSLRSSTPERTQRICATVHAVHDICLQSTKTFLDSHLANRRARGTNSANSVSISNGQSRAGDGTNTTSTGGININIGNTTTTRSHIPQSSNSLLNNISTICSMLWAGSQRDRLDVLNVERSAVENMGRILCWAETVALGDYDEWTMADEEALRQVLKAGRSLCHWLQVPDGVQEMDALESDAMEPGFGVF
ncbi:hypothetical protein F5Y05DRAFT_95841 [Hypoxylon sp. FL0543]|nr:hypothetical protein F5Y05DRAFT_95841 [Hypoxylon sp. FL0543]